MVKKSYGARGQTWHADFIAYVEQLAASPEYAGMPDAYTGDGRVQWEAPSNRQSGRFKDTHHKRRDWWRAKAQELGIDSSSPQWISRTAKTLHPTKSKPCKRCGRVMRLQYVYPQQRLLDRLRKLRGFDTAFAFRELEPIDELLERLAAHHGETVLASVHEALDPQHALKRPKDTSLASLSTWMRDVFIPSEPSLLSPGAMSNAPDRFDGFHSFNLCCRGRADTGRHAANLSSYVTDRRVFEFWNDGDWIAADCLMGMVRSGLRDVACFNGHDGPCTADHIGPLSLGFAHRAEFQLLCRACNTGKNNRLSARDVGLLIQAERAGEQVVSWHNRALWNARKASVVDNETALRLTKMLRDNRRTMMSVLASIAEAGHWSFLASLLRLGDADHDVELQDLVITDSVVRPRKTNRTARTTKYAAEQKARRLRIAFEALDTYVQKESRNGLAINSKTFQRSIDEALEILNSAEVLTKQLSHALAGALSSSDEQLRRVAPNLQAINDPAFLRAKSAIERAMRLAAVEVSAKWDDERYVRAAKEETESDSSD